MEQTNDKEAKVHAIANHIIGQIKNGQIGTIEDSGLLSGTFGVILFLSHYLHFFPNNVSQSTFDQYLQNCIKKLTDEEQSHTYYNGLPGIFDGLDLMNKIGLLDIDYSKIEQISNLYLKKRMKNDIKNFNYDFLHGGIGIGFHFKKNKNFTQAVVNELESCAIRENNMAKWKSVINLKHSLGYNISLSHGMSSLIVYLSEIFKNGEVSNGLVGELLFEAVNYILSQEIDFEQYGSHFPSLSLDNGWIIEKSRLAWCYGDLGIAIALWQAGNALNDSCVQNKAIEIFKHSAYRRNAENEEIKDAGLCHGSAGVAMCFNYMYCKTGEILFMESYKYWLSRTLEFGTNLSGICGYERYAPFEGTLNIPIRNNYKLLDGIAGIGLFLLTSISPKISDDWNKLFLLF